MARCPHELVGQGSVRLRLTALSANGTKKRKYGIAVRGLFVAGLGDAEARVRFLEGAIVGGLQDNYGQAPDLDIADYLRGRSITNFGNKRPSFYLTREGR